MYKINNNVVNIEPWGTPNLHPAQVDCAFNEYLSINFINS